MGEASRDFRPDINGLRCVAVIVVVLFHMGVPGFSGGFVGVDVFFVISGYLMTQLISTKLESGRYSLIDFYAARARRIVPGLVGLIVPLLIVGYLCLIPRDYRNLARDAIAALGFFSNLVFMHHNGYFDDASRDNWLLHTWSLAVEWQFYVLYPLLLAAGWRLGRRRAVRSFAIVAFVASFALSVFLTPRHPTGAFFLLPFRSWELIFGGLVFFWAARARPRPWLCSAGLLLILASVFFFSEEFQFPGYWAIAPVAGAAAIIAARSDTRILVNGFTQFIGTISYSLYLWHWPIAVAVRYFDLRLSGAITIASLALAILLGYLSFKLIEVPFRQVGREMAAGWYLVRCALALIPLTLLIGLIYVRHGLPGRADPALAVVVASNEATIDDWTFPTRCENYQVRVTADSPPIYCELGAPSSRKILIWGDSHMEQLYSALQDLERADQSPRAQVLFATSGGCLPVRGVGRRGFNCAEFSEAVFARAVQPDIDTVIIGGFWSANLGFGPENKGPLVRKAAPILVPFDSPKEALTFVMDGLSRDVAALIQHGKRVVIVLPFPSYQESIPRFLAKAAFWNQKRELNHSKTLYTEHNESVAAALRSVAASNHAEFIDPSTILCESASCAIQRDGISLYRDAHHLTPSASLALEPLFKPLIDE